jgi:hypothetical protein
MATFPGVWNSIRGLQTTAGTFVSFYHPGEPNEWVTIVQPDGGTQDVRAPALVDWFLAAEDGVVVIHYARNDSGGKTPVRVPTAIACGQPTAWLVTGGTGPAGVAGAQGPQGEQGEPGEPGEPGSDAVALTADDIDRIAERVWLMPPPEHLKDLAGVELGALSQIIIAYLMTKRQDLKQLEIQRFDEAALGLVSGGYAPKIQGG